MDPERIAIIGAGEAAYPIISKAKEMGLITVAFARDGSFAQRIVDIFVEENSFDIKFISKKCRELEVKGVMASSELTTKVAAEVAFELGLPGNDVENGFAGKNKYIMRCRVQRLDSVKQPNFELFREECRYNFPLVVKSVDSCGKRGIALVTNEQEFIQAVDNARRNSSDGSVLLEEYLAGGKEYSIECIVGNGEAYIVQYTQKDSAGAPHFVELGHHQPADLSSDEKRKINIAVNDILRVLGIRCGMAHVELKIINEEIYFIEMGARAGGDHIADMLIPLSVDFDYFKSAIECSLGRFVPKPITNVACAGIYTCCKQNSELKKIFDNAQTANWCIDSTYNNIFDEAESNVDAMNSGYIIYCSDQKIDIDNYTLKGQICPVLVNNFPNAYSLIKEFYCNMKSPLSEEQLDVAIKKWLREGHVIGILKNKKILGMGVLYCKHIDTKDAYSCNLYVLDEYRGLGYSVLLRMKMFDFCRRMGFSSVSAHVAENNFRALSINKKLGFAFTGNEKYVDGERQLEMRYML